MMDRIEISRVKTYYSEEKIRVRLVHGKQVFQVDMSLHDFAAAVTGRIMPCEVKVTGPTGGDAGAGEKRL
jgi:hypothetical protein